MNDIQGVLEKNYLITVQNISLAPRGFVAETYKIQTNSENYFLKTITKGRFTENTAESLPVLNELYEKCHAPVNYPIKTKDNTYYVDHDGKIYILFNFIEGHSVTLTKWSESVERKTYQCIASIHANTHYVTTHIKKENFRLSIQDEFETDMHVLFTKSNLQSVERELKNLVSQYKDEIESDWKELQELSAICNTRSQNSFVITHGDFIGNNIVTPTEEVYLIDWDDILLAPPERDTWFLYGNDERWERFMNEYKNFYPEYTIDRTFYRFYLYQRYIIDMTDWLSNILNPHLTEEDKYRQLQDLKRDCFEEWLRPLIRKTV